MQPILIVHGGAGDITEARVPGKFSGCKNSVREGFKILKNGGSALDAVEKAVNVMELDENFNAGYGSVLNIDGYIELEASIMNGITLSAGCVTLLNDIMHPISVARRVLEKTNHNFLGGSSAMEFAKKEKFDILPEGSLVTANALAALEEFKERQRKGLSTIFARTELDNANQPQLGEPGTVGAVALDSQGNIAVATSTGGITGKMAGRIGDTPILGSGTYADNLFGGVSTTGHGETIMRYNLAQKILERIKYKNTGAQEATEFATKDMTARLSGTAGAITIDVNGEIGVYFTSKRMAWAYMRDNGDEIHFGINHGDDYVDKIESSE